MTIIDNPEGFFGRAIPDFDRLENVLGSNNIVLIIKPHPLTENDPVYRAMKTRYSDSKYVWFGNDKNDIYKVFHGIDLAIVDYSSIYYDLLATGVRRFIRYNFDNIREMFREFAYQPDEYMSGECCETFDELLAALPIVTPIPEEEAVRLKTLFWSYAPSSCEAIINCTLEFKPSKLPERILFSFDVFDTIIQRKGLLPICSPYRRCRL